MEDELRLSLDMIQEERHHNLADVLEDEKEKQERFLDQLAFLLSKDLETNERNQNRN